MRQFNLPLFVTLLVCLPATRPTSARADSGTLRASSRQHGYQVTVFTSPTPLRAGTVDVSVLVQDGATGAALDSSVQVQAWPRGRPGEAVRCTATPEAATNKLFRAAVFELPEPGWWEVVVQVAGLPEPVEAHFAVEAAGPLPAWQAVAPWVAWPVLVVAGFVAHQRLVRRKHWVRRASTALPEGLPQ